MHKNLMDNGFSSRLVVVGLLSFAAVMASMGTLKLYLPPQTSWALIGLPIVGAAMLEIRRQGWLQPMFNWKHAIPLVALLATIVLAVVTNELTHEDLIFSAATFLKLVLIWVLLVMLIQTRVTVRTMEVALVSAMLIGALGFGLAAIFNAGLMISDDNRLGWSFAWFGIFWKMGMYAFPFLMWRSLRNPSWTDLPALLLATLVVSLDASRTGLLAVVLTFAAMVVIGIFMFPVRNALIGAAVTAVALVMSYMLVQPAMVDLVRQGEFARGYVGWALLIFIVVVFVAEIYRPLKAVRYENNLKLRHNKRVVAVILLFFALASSLVAAYLIESGSSSAVDRFAVTDTARLEMLNAGLKAAVENFPFGGGLGTTTAFGMHVHFTYIQLIGDIGVLGLISYLGIFGVFGLWYIQSPLQARAELVPGLAVVGVFLLQGAFAPLTNELSEWLPVILVAAAFYFAANGERAKVLSYQL